MAVASRPGLVADAHDVFAAPARGGLPRHGRREVTPRAVEHSDDGGASVVGEHVHGPPESPFWLTTPLAIVNQPLLTASTVPQLSPVDHAEVADRLPGHRHDRRIGDQGPSAGQDVVQRDVR